MSNVSIYEKNWIDLVFEDKNKTYGAYQLRQENSKTTLFAFFSGILFLFSLFGVWFLVSSFNSKPIEKPIEDLPIIKVTDFHYPKPNKPVVPKVTSPQNPSTVKPLPGLSHIVVVKTPQATVEVPTNATLPTSPSATPGTGPDTPNTGTEGPAVAIIVPVVDKGPVRPDELDRLPEYPGGIKKFYEYVGNNFENPGADESLGEVSVTMSFVIEKDGSMSSIRVLRSSDKKMEAEAIRVLKSLKVKWAPGFKDGDKMRTLYTLPIKVAL